MNITINNLYNKNKECSLCSLKIKHEVYNDESQICEEYLSCTNGCFSYEFSYGFYRYHINDKEFVWNYKTNNEEVKLIKQNINKEIKEVQKKVVNIKRKEEEEISSLNNMSNLF